MHDIYCILKITGCSQKPFKKHFQGTPVSRLKLQRWKRNACVVLGNIGTEEDLSELKCLCECGDAIIAEHASWAIDQITSRVKKS